MLILLAPVTAFERLEDLCRRCCPDVLQAHTASAWPLPVAAFRRFPTRFLATGGGGKITSHTLWTALSLLFVSGCPFPACTSRRTYSSSIQTTFSGVSVGRYKRATVSRAKGTTEDFRRACRAGAPWLGRQLRNCREPLLCAPQGEKTPPLLPKKRTRLRWQQAATCSGVTSGGWRQRTCWGGKAGSGPSCLRHGMLA